MFFRPHILLMLCLILGACDAGHLGNPLTLPARAIGSAASNAVYNTRRARVSAYVMAHHPAFAADIRTGSGPHLIQSAMLAEVSSTAFRVMTGQLAKDIRPYQTDAEALVVALMVHGA